jgi:hypothetical protein
MGWPAISVGTQEDPPSDPAGGAQRLAAPNTEDLTATAVLVKGRVRQAPVGVSATDTDAWKPVNQGDELSAGTQIRVSIRSTLVLQYGDDTVVQLKSMTLASLDQLYKTETSKHSKFGLAYGALRGSVREKDLRSDMVIESPTVTCSKEGTEDFEIRVMRGSLWWEANGPTVGEFLIRDVGTGRTERLSFGQLASFFTMTSPAVRRNLAQQVVDIYGARYMSSGEQDFNLFVDSGQTVTGPGLGVRGFGVLPGSGLKQFAGRLPGDISDLADQLGLRLERNAGLLFRQVESRFGTGPFPGTTTTAGKYRMGR